MSRTVTRRRTLAAMAGMTVMAAGFGPARAAKARVHRVEIKQFKFAPAQLKVRPGDRIIWTNHDIAPHTATAMNESWDTGRIDKDQSVETTVTDEMTGAFFCRYHPAMKGVIEIG